jgi:hypothetical protein
MGADDDSPEKKRRIIDAQRLLPGESGFRSIMASVAG